MEKVIEKIGLYDMLCALVGGVMCIMSIKLLDISFFRFIFSNVPDSMNLVFLLFIGSLVGIVIQEIASNIEHRKKFLASSKLFRFREYGISHFLNWSSGQSTTEGSNSNETARMASGGKTNAVFNNSMEIEMARAKAYELLPKKRGPLNDNFVFSKSEAQFVYQKMNKDVSHKKGSSNIEMINALGSLSRSLCVWFFILIFLYGLDSFLRWKTNELLAIPYPDSPAPFFQVLQVAIIVAVLFALSVIMYIRAGRYQRYRLRSIVRLYAYYDDNNMHGDNSSDLQNA